MRTKKRDELIINLREATNLLMHIEDTLIKINQELENEDPAE
jgi:hypothetical protein